MQEAEVKIKVKLNNTEDPQRVIHAVSNVVKCEGPVILESVSGKFMIFQGTGKEFLSPLRRLLHEQRILSAARRVVKKGLRDGIFHFCLNKQAAFANQVSFSEEKEESPLGSIVFEIKTRDPEAFLDWLTQRRRGGSVAG
ncbi:MAG: hypothetical protein JSW01_05915 [Candidatus Bathyarchaeota archaeon]|nr:MAG: hypothetical protein JSW01_05915 [Candidatus Bathyarchaeota archaeon]